MSEELGRKEVISYGAGDFACGMIYNFVFTYVFYFYSDIIKISLPAISIIMIAGRGMGAVMDFFAGMLIDRTRTKYGSARPYLLWFFIPLGIVTVMLFTTVSGSPVVKAVYAVITYVLYNTIYALLNDPYTMLMSTITERITQRMRLNISKTICSGIGGLIAMSVTLPLAALFDAALGRELEVGIFVVNGFTIISGSYGILGMIFLLICFWNTKERVIVKKEKITVKEAYSIAGKNKYWCVGLALGFFIGLALTLKTTTTLYYTEYVMGQGKLSNVLLTCHMVSAIGAILCMPVCLRLLGRKRTFLACSGMLVIGNMVQWAATKTLAAFIVGSIAASFSLNLLNSLSVFVIFDTIDYTQRTHQVRPQGFMFSVYCIVCKLSTAIAAVLLSRGLEQAGYVAGEVQGISSMQCIQFFYITASVLLAFCIGGTALLFDMKECSLINELHENC